MWSILNKFLKKKSVLPEDLSFFSNNPHQAKMKISVDKAGLTTDELWALQNKTLRFMQELQMEFPKVILDYEQVRLNTKN